MPDGLFSDVDRMFQVFGRKKLGGAKDAPPAQGQPGAAPMTHDQYRQFLSATDEAGQGYGQPQHSPGQGYGQSPGGFGYAPSVISVPSMAPTPMQQSAVLSPMQQQMFPAMPPPPTSASNPYAALPPMPGPANPPPAVRVTQMSGYSDDDGYDSQEDGTGSVSDSEPSVVPFPRSQSLAATGGQPMMRALPSQPSLPAIPPMPAPSPDPSLPPLPAASPPIPRQPLPRGFPHHTQQQQQQRQERAPEPPMRMQMERPTIPQPTIPQQQQALSLATPIGTTTTEMSPEERARRLEERAAILRAKYGDSESDSSAPPPKPLHEQPANSQQTLLSGTGTQNQSFGFGFGGQPSASENESFEPPLPRRSQSRSALFPVLTDEEKLLPPSPNPTASSIAAPHRVAVVAELLQAAEQYNALGAWDGVAGYEPMESQTPEPPKLRTPMEREQLAVNNKAPAATPSSATPSQRAEVESLKKLLAQREAAEAKLAEQTKKMENQLAEQARRIEQMRAEQAKKEREERERDRERERERMLFVPPPTTTSAAAPSTTATGSRKPPPIITSKAPGGSGPPDALAFVSTHVNGVDIPYQPLPEPTQLSAIRRQRPASPTQSQTPAIDPALHPPDLGFRIRVPEWNSYYPGKRYKLTDAEAGGWRFRLTLYPRGRQGCRAGFNCSIEIHCVSFDGDFADKDKTVDVRFQFVVNGTAVVTKQGMLKAGARWGMDCLVDTGNWETAGSPAEGKEEEVLCSARFWYAPFDFPMPEGEVGKHPLLDLSKCFPAAGGNLADLSVRVGDKRWMVHRMVLGLCSVRLVEVAGAGEGRELTILFCQFVRLILQDFFRNLLDLGPSEPLVDQTVVFRQVRPEIIQYIIDYAYNPHYSLPSGTPWRALAELFAACETYQILHLQDLVVSRLGTVLEPGNIVPLFLLARKTEHKRLQKLITDYVGSNYEKLRDAKSALVGTVLKLPEQDAAQVRKLLDSLLEAAERFRSSQVGMVRSPQRDRESGQEGDGGAATSPVRSKATQRVGERLGWSSGAADGPRPGLRGADGLPSRNWGGGLTGFT